MAEQQQANRIPLGVIAGLSAAAVAAAGFGAWWAMKPRQLQTTAEQSTTSLQPPSPPPVAQTVQIYWLKNTENSLELVSRPVTVSSSESNIVLQEAFNGLLKGSTDAALDSTIPQGTKLRGMTIQNDGIHIDLSQEFTTGGGSASMSSRLAQVIYTATSLQPKAKVWIDVEGKPLEVLGGEGLLLEQPLTRQSFKENFTL